MDWAAQQGLLREIAEAEGMDIGRASRIMRLNRNRLVQAVLTRSG